jgi:hypothetical protein
VTVSQADRGGQTARAEEIVDDATGRVDDWTDRVAKWTARAAERVREEVEDVWADAQSIRRGE